MKECFKQNSNQEGSTSVKKSAIDYLSYGNITSSNGGNHNGGGVTKIRATGWCFNLNGRFTNETSASRQAIFDVSTGESASRKGYYRIDNYSIYFVFDNGTKAAFCYLDDDEEHIGINGRRLMKGY